MNISDYLQLNLSEKEEFFKEVVRNKKTRTVKENIEYTVKQRKRKTSAVKKIGFHQKEGHLTFIEELERKDIKSKKLYYLCLCDCGNWHICRSDAFGKENTKGGCFSCGCLNKESFSKNILNPKVQEKRVENLKKVLDEKAVHIGDKINKWEITQTKTEGRRRYVKGICPYCKKESHWIRFDGIQAGTVHSCGCSKESIGEEKIKNILKEKEIKFIQEKTFPGCVSPKTKRLLRFDFYVEDKYLIEFDGKQHFQIGGDFVKDEQALQEIKFRDSFKNNWCLNNNIPLIRIPYTHLKKLVLEDLLLETTTFLVNPQGEVINE